MLSVKYAPDVPPSLRDVVEHHARTHGLPLDVLEVIGASLDFVESFIVACEDGHVEEFLRKAGLAPPADPVARARWEADRLFGAEA